MLVRYLKRLGWSRGVLRGHRGWAALWVGISFVRLLRRTLGDEVEHVSTEGLRPGQAVLITSLGPRPTRRQRRRAVRSQAG